MSNAGSRTRCGPPVGARAGTSTPAVSTIPCGQGSPGNTGCGPAGSIDEDTTSSEHVLRTPANKSRTRLGRDLGDVSVVVGAAARGGSFRTPGCLPGDLGSAQ